MHCNAHRIFVGARSVRYRTASTREEAYRKEHREETTRRCDARTVIRIVPPENEDVRLPDPVRAMLLEMLEQLAG